MRTFGMGLSESCPYFSPSLTPISVYMPLYTQTEQPRYAEQGHRSRSCCFGCLRRTFLFFSTILYLSISHALIFTVSLQTRLQEHAASAKALAASQLGIGAAAPAAAAEGDAVAAPAATEAATEAAPAAPAATAAPDAAPAPAAPAPAAP